MDCRLKIILLICLFCSSFYAQDGSVFDGADIYPVFDKSDCAPEFEYNGKIYLDCTIADGNNGDLPWCSLTKEYQNLITYCYDFRKTTLRCLPNFTMPDGKNYTQPAVLSKTSVYPQCKTNHPVIKYRYSTDALSSPSKKSINHTADCPQVYKNISKYHTMCFGPSPYATPVPLNPTEIQDVLDMHNSYRSEVTAECMFMLTWDEDLAKMAQQRSNLCVFEHDLAVNRIIPKYGWKNGQNIVMSSEIRSTPASLIDMMLGSEKPNFRYNNTCYPGEDSCLHYTQAMIYDLTRVGCGQTHCIYPDRIERYITCNYIKSQYSDSYNRPYVPSSQPAIKCPKYKVGKLCNCSNKICDYHEGVDEYLDPATCTCKSPYGKRSIEKRDAVEDELRAHEKANAYVRPGNAGSFAKRHLKTLRVPQTGKRSIDKRHLKTLRVPQTGK